MLVSAFLKCGYGETLLSMALQGPFYDQGQRFSFHTCNHPSTMIITPCILDCNPPAIWIQPVLLNSAFASLPHRLLVMKSGGPFQPVPLLPSLQNVTLLTIIFPEPPPEPPLSLAARESTLSWPSLRVPDPLPPSARWTALLRPLLS